MSPQGRAAQDPGALGLVEEAVHLLRQAPPAVLACYYLGSLPFVLGLLYFWTDMSRSPAAREHCAEASLGMALLFAWMKAWQAASALRLRAFRAGVPPGPWTAGRTVRMVVLQAAFHATGLFALCAAAVLALPFGWVYAFFQTLTALGDGDGSRPMDVARRAWAQAALWPRQNHLLLAIAAGFGFLVFLNWLATAVAGPALLKALLGIETAFTRSMGGVFNTTVLAAVLGATYLCLDPIVKAAYALRLFYAEARSTGEDLLTDLRLQSQRGPWIGTILLGSVLLLAAEGPRPAAAAEHSAPAAAARDQGIDPRGLDEAILRVLNRREFAWRLPRPEGSEEPEEEGLLGAFFGEVWRLIGRGFEAVWDWVESLIEWFRGLFPEPDADSRNRRPSLPGWLRVALIAALAAAVAGLVVLFAKRRRRTKTVAGEPQPNLPVPDLADSETAADELPADGWASLARELWQRGEPRLALRALYLASLAHLAEKGVIAIARHKSNRDYQVELARRAHAVPEVAEAFASNVALFERVWFGMHAVTRELADGFAANQQRIMAFEK